MIINQLNKDVLKKQIEENERHHKEQIDNNERHHINQMKASENGRQSK